MNNQFCKNQGFATGQNLPTPPGSVHRRNPCRLVTVILDFRQLPPGVPEHADLRLFFEECRRLGRNPRAAEQRQAFNQRMLQSENADFLIGRYGEDRTEMLRDTSIGREGRVLHLGIDLFAAQPVDLFTPEASIVRAAGCEEGAASYGHFLLLEHPETVFPRWSFWGHLSRALPSVGSCFRAGEKIARMGDLGENGGWSVHLHLQWLRECPPPGTTPPGYARPQEWGAASQAYPDPVDWIGPLPNDSASMMTRNGGQKN